MNTTHTTAPDPGYYVPTPADCLEAGMKQSSRMDNWYLWPFPEKKDAIAFGSEDRAFLCQLDPRAGIDYELVFANRDACMAFLHNHTDRAAEPAPVSDWQAFISAFDQITLSVDERMDFVLKTHWGACAVLYAYPGGDYSVVIDKTVTGFKDLQAKISAHLAAEAKRKADKTEGGTN